MIKLTDPIQIVDEFQKRQKRIVAVAFISFAVMIPTVIYLRTISTTYALYATGGVIVPLIGFYFYTFRCPACGARVSQRRQMLHMPIVCKSCKVVLESKIQ